MLNRKIAIAAGLFGAVLIQSPAQAVEARVMYKAHELDTVAGQRAVTDRVSRAVRRACSTYYGTMRPRFVRQCKADLGGQIVVKIGDPNVTALWKRNNGQQLASRSR